jgi:hypothetical protein
VTEAGWLTCADPVPMLEFLVGRASDRKLRLFGAACTRRVWDRVAGPDRAAVEVAERFADALAGPAELRAARQACKYVGGGGAWYAAASRPTVAARNAALSALAGCDSVAERAAQADLLRDIAGTPFRTVKFDARWRTAGILCLASTIYEDRTFDRLSALADALQGVGCDDGDILNHCHSEGMHVRGCWVVDLVLNKG